MAKTDDYYRKRAWKRLGIAAAIVAVAAIAFVIVLRSDSFQKIASIETSAQQIATENISSKFSAPVPLVATTTNLANSKNTATNGSGGVSGYTLTDEGVIADTNTQRAENGKLTPLEENMMLNDIALRRLQDMFAKQYFAHISPSSSSAETVAAAVGYQYISLGENLALGNFDGDQGVVTAWMNSPGHRANILDAHYTEIGVAVGEGEFQGNEAWIAVQIFGRPASACPAPDPGLKADIDTAQGQITQLQAELQTTQQQMNAMQSQSNDAYQQAVSNYNALVDQYNAVIAQVKTEIAQYNNEVNAYNTCIAS